MRFMGFTLGCVNHEEVRSLFYSPVPGCEGWLTPREIPNMPTTFPSLISRMNIASHVRYSPALVRHRYLKMGGVSPWMARLNTSMIDGKSSG